MNNEGLHIFTWADTEVRLNVTILLLPALFVLPSAMNGDYASAASSMWILLVAFCSVLLHEFGHIFASRKVGGETGNIVLTAIGGAATIDPIFKRGAHEIFVALAGPAVNLTIISVAGPLYLLLDAFGFEGDLIHKVTKDIFYVNSVLAIFNLLPLYPMDGGRVMRGIMSEFMDLRTATRIVVGFGCLLGLLVAYVGFATGIYGLTIIGLLMPILGMSEMRAVEKRYASENDALKT
jgi:Zn-dependent protease